MQVAPSVPRTPPRPIQSSLMLTNRPTHRYGTHTRTAAPRNLGKERRNVQGRQGGTAVRKRRASRGPCGGWASTRAQAGWLQHRASAAAGGAPRQGCSGRRDGAARCVTLCKVQNKAQNKDRQVGGCDRGIRTHGVSTPARRPAPRYTPVAVTGPAPGPAPTHPPCFGPLLRRARAAAGCDGYRCFGIQVHSSQIGGIGTAGPHKGHGDRAPLSTVGGARHS